MSEFWHKVRFLFQRRRFERELEQEVLFHLEMAAEEQSEPAARRAFGNVLRMKEGSREMWTFHWIENLGRDLRYAGRVLRKSPGFTLIAIATLALGIGANTAVFSVVDAVLLRPLPYPEPEQLSTLARFGSFGMYSSADGRTCELMQAEARGLDSAVYSGLKADVNLAVNGHVRYVRQQRVSAGFFRVLGVAPWQGREFTQAEDTAGGPAVAVLSYGLWKSMLNVDQSVVDRRVMLRGEAYTVIGVMPPSFRPSSQADIWTPLRPSTTGEGEGTNYGIIARLRPGVSWEQAESQVRSIGEVRRREEKQEGEDFRLGLVPLQKGLNEDVRLPLLIVWMAVGMVLLIACVNIASLLVARAAGRSREIATRMALGGGSAVVFRQLLTESLLLAALGGAAGIALGYLGIHGFEWLARDTLNLWQPMQLDGRVLLATGGIALVSCMLFGVYPAWQSTWCDIRTSLAEGGGRAIAGGRGHWPRRLLVVAEVTLSVALLIGAGLLVRSFLYLRNLRPGFDANKVVTATLSLQDARYRTSEQVNRLFNKSLERIREIPGVETAAVTLSLPYERPLQNGFRLPDSQEYHGAYLSYVTPEYFRALRIPLLAGRDFTPADGPRSGKVAMVNEAFARKYLSQGNAVGGRIVMGEDAMSIVGVVGNVPLKEEFGTFGPLNVLPQAFIPAAQVSDEAMQVVHVWFSPSWVVRTSAPPKDVMAGMQRAMESVEPLLPFSNFRGILELRSSALGGQRLEALLMGVMAALALLLAAIGIYGLIAHSVAERTRELGIRMAMGATTGQAVSLVTLPGVVLAGIGCAFGCMLGWGVVRLMRHLIWGVSPTDPWTFVGVPCLFLLVAGAASVLPAWRITRLNPASTLRNE
jgi:predicted permease